MFTSPLARALGTAHEIARILDLPVTVVPGLAACAAAVKRRGGIDRVPLLSMDAMRDVCPEIDGVDAAAPLDFAGACDAVVRRSPPPVLLISHREGIRELVRAPGLRLPYCATARFDTRVVDAEDVVWTLSAISEPCGSAAASGSKKKLRRKRKT